MTERYLQSDVVQLSEEARTILTEYAEEDTSLEMKDAIHICKIFGRKVVSLLNGTLIFRPDWTEEPKYDYRRTR